MESTFILIYLEYLPLPFLFLLAGELSKRAIKQWEKSVSLKENISSVRELLQLGNTPHPHAGPKKVHFRNGLGSGWSTVACRSCHHRGDYCPCHRWSKIQAVYLSHHTQLGNWLPKHAVYMSWFRQYLQQLCNNKFFISTNHAGKTVFCHHIVSTLCWFWNREKWNRLELVCFCSNRTDGWDDPFVHQHSAAKI